MPRPRIPVKVVRIDGQECLCADPQGRDVWLQQSSVDGAGTVSAWLWEHTDLTDAKRHALRVEAEVEARRRVPLPLTRMQAGFVCPVWVYIEGLSDPREPELGSYRRVLSESELRFEAEEVTDGQEVLAQILKAKTDALRKQVALAKNLSHMERFLLVATDKRPVEETWGLVPDEERRS